MPPKRMIALAGGTIFLLCLVVLPYRSRNDDSDGQQAITRVGLLKKGMTMPKVIHTLHPERAKPYTSLTYTVRPVGKDEHEMVHALTPDRYLVLTCSILPSSIKGVSSPTLRSWELKPGTPPQEDVVIGHHLALGSFKFRYWRRSISMEIFPRSRGRSRRASPA